MQNLYFVALIPPLQLAREVDNLRHQLWHFHNTQKALNSPPHITLIPPFKYSQRSRLISTLQSFNSKIKKLPLTLDGFNHFGQKVIFLSVLLRPELKSFQSQLWEYCRQELDLSTDRPDRDYHPHLTLAFKDLKKKEFHAAWAQLSQQNFKRHFTTARYYLLRHSGKRWLIDEVFTL